MFVWHYEGHYYGHNLMVFASPDVAIKHLDLDVDWRPPYIIRIESSAIAPSFFISAFPGLRGPVARFAASRLSACGHESTRNHAPSNAVQAMTPQSHLQFTYKILFRLHWRCRESAIGYRSPSICMLNFGVRFLSYTISIYIFYKSPSPVNPSPSIRIRCPFSHIPNAGELGN